MWNKQENKYREVVSSLNGIMPEKLNDDVLDAILDVFYDENARGVGFTDKFKFSEDKMKIIRDSLYNRYHKSSDEYINLVRSDIPDDVDFMRSEVIVYKSVKYGMFHKKYANRGKENKALKKILDDPHRVKNLMMSMLLIGYKYIPILVDETFGISDGQGRFEACKALGLPIYFIIQKNVDINDIILLNTSSGKASAMEVVSMKAGDGMPDYVRLQTIIDTYPDLNLNSIGHTLFGDSIGSNDIINNRFSLSEEIYNAKQEDLAFVDRMAKFLKSYKKLLDVPPERFLYAIAQTTVLDGIHIDEERLKRKIKASLVNKGIYNTYIGNKNTMKMAIQVLDEIYNKRLGDIEKSSNDNFGIENIAEAYSAYMKRRKYMSKEEKGVGGFSLGMVK